MPKRAGTPPRQFRITDELYSAAKAVAIEQGETVSDVVRRSLEAYVADHAPKKRARRAFGGVSA